MRISTERLRELFEYRDGSLYWKQHRYPKRVGTRAGTTHKRIQYRVLNIDGVNAMEHRLIWQLHYGRLPAVLDHINGDKQDNRIENLREVTLSQNKQNTGKYKCNTSGFKGVYFKGWEAHITKDGTQRSIGHFKSPEDAATAYNFAAAELHGQYARYNTVPQPWLNETEND